jgi:hypothetical protein
MQVELFNRKRCKTRIELASAIHDYIEHFTTRAGGTARSACSPQSNTKTSTYKPTTPPDSRPTTPRNPGQISDTTEPGADHSVV